MNIILYRNHSEPERMIKNLTNEQTLTGYLREQSNVINPEFLIQGDPADFPSFYNYAYIPDFSRYYFMGDPVAVRSDLIMLPLSVDVLMSFKDDILSNDAIVDKQRDNGNVYFNDGSWANDSREFYTVKSFTNGFNDNGEYILITAGAPAV